MIDRAVMPQMHQECSSLPCDVLELLSSQKELSPFRHDATGTALTLFRARDDAAAVAEFSLMPSSLPKDLVA